MASESVASIPFTHQGQILKPPSPVNVPASSSQWERWMNLLKQSAKPPFLLSESVALFFAGVAVTSIFGALDKWTGDLSETIDGVEKLKWRELIIALIYSVSAVAFSLIGLFAFFGGRHIRSQDVKFSALVAEEMEEHYKACIKQSADEKKEQRKREKEQSA
jgi:hypothetical protein